MLIIWPHIENDKMPRMHNHSNSFRYIDYVAKLVTVPPVLPHNHPIGLLSITLTPIPTFNRLK